tara:strand:+ start:562 stop:1305 length:744 start_codon:yes stop_codon:yes gene_type:complete
MKIIISPAKKLTSERLSVSKASAIHFQNEASYLVQTLRSFSANDLKKIMSLSDNLANLNYHRYQRWDLGSEEVGSAIYMFQGDVYKGLKADQLLEDELDFAQNNLRIISGLYGLLKPLDLIFPYRLEMGTKLQTEKGNNLYEFWGDKLNKALSYEMQDKEVLVNLASQEYSKAVQMERLKHPIITPVFKDYKNGKLKVISFFAKKARGEMANFIITNKITESNDLKLFANEGYRFSDESNGELLFTR